MDRRQFLTLAGSAFAAAVLLPKVPTPEHRQAPPGNSGLQAAKVYCGSSVNANGRFRHYLVNGRRITERVMA